MVRKTIGEINQYEGTTVNPLQFPDKVFELYSVPSFDTDYPEIIAGADIGSSKVTVQEGDVLVCKINPRINRVWVVKHHTEHPLLASSEWIVVRNPDMDADYLRWYFSSPTFRVMLNSEVAGIGGSLTRAQPKRVAQYTVPMCSLIEQRHISATLNQVESLISLRKQQIAKLDELVKARFVEMFGRYPENTFGWDTATIRDVVADVRYGSSRPAVDGGKYPYLRMNNITYGGELDLTDTKRIDVPENELDKCTVRRGDVLFNRTNSKELVGKTCVYNRDEMMVLAGFVIRVRVNERVIPEFLSAFLNTDFSKQMLLNMCKTAIGQANINAQEMQDIAIYVPPLDLQKQFAVFATQTDQQKSTIQQSLAQLELLKKALMQKYFG